MKHIDELTIKEFDQLQELLKTDNKKNKKSKDIDYISIFELFGEDFTQLSVADFKKKWQNISSMTISHKPISPVIKLKNHRIKCLINLTKLNAAQFIDLQTVITNGNKLNELISVYAIPQKRTFLGWKTLKYNEGYDILELRNDIYENMKISDAQSLSDFFLQSSTRLLEVTQKYLKKKLMKMKLKEFKKAQVIKSSNGFKWLKTSQKLSV